MKTYSCSAFQHSCKELSPDCSFVMHLNGEGSYMRHRFDDGETKIRINCVVNGGDHVWWSYTTEEPNGQQVLDFGDER
jgi:hypothetical protein